MLVLLEDNPIPKVGQLLYKEYRSENGDFADASLVFVDEEIVEGNQWMYTQIAHLEDIGNGLEVYTGIEAGGMPQKYTRVATDDDLKKFLDLIKEGKITEDSDNLEKWMEKLENDNYLLASEKERIKKIVTGQ